MPANFGERYRNMTMIFPWGATATSPMAMDVPRGNCKDPEKLNLTTEGMEEHGKGFVP